MAIRSPWRDALRGHQAAIRPDQIVRFGIGQAIALQTR